MQEQHTQEGSLLKIVSCGSVDDGKSTLIGHMLYDAKLIFADQAQALELDSKVGSAGGKLDYSLLLDGLVAEREQGITIDVAYRYFNTRRRSFIIADAPGHEQYTRNMAVGASFADLAIILVDAAQGPLKQTYRHIRICALMGIKHFVFAINKMDTVHYDRVRYDMSCRDIKAFCASFSIESLVMIPVSAVEGDNVVNPSSNMPWYDGPALLSYLEEVDVSSQTSEHGFTMPVQRVCRPDQTFRGFQGTVSTGSVKVGDEVFVWPAQESSHVSTILVAGKEASSASAGEAITVALEDEIDASRGCVIAAEADVSSASFLVATLLWMDDVDLLTGKNYLFKIGSKLVPGTVIKIRYWVDVNTGEKIHADRVRKNEIAVCEISLGEKVVYEPFDINRNLGSLILIDRLTNATAGCGVIDAELNRSDNLTWHDMDITRTLREGQLGQRAVTLWFTGLSGSGKSTLANALEKRLYALGKHTMLLDGDNVRLGLNKNLGFSEDDRIENIRRIAEVAKLMNDAGLIVLTSFISPYVRDRRNAAEIIGAQNFYEIYVSTPLEECERRDVKGLYAKARRGEILDFTGISSPYEEPQQPALSIDTSKESTDAAVERIIGLILSE